MRWGVIIPEARMPSTERVTVTLPAEIVEEIDRLESNRSRFILEAVRRDLLRRRRQALHRSLRNPHPESVDLAEAGLSEWGESLPEDDAAGELLDKDAGRAVQWTPGEGWVEVSE
jgi:Arc/MetJ-type ribon-helix-helix transcriptional regulator